MKTVTVMSERKNATSSETSRHENVVDFGLFSGMYWVRTQEGITYRYPIDRIRVITEEPA